MEWNACWKGPNDRNRHKNRAKRSGQAGWFMSRTQTATSPLPEGEPMGTQAGEVWDSVADWLRQWESKNIANQMIGNPLISEGGLVKLLWRSMCVLSCLQPQGSVDTEANLSSLHLFPATKLQLEPFNQSQYNSNVTEPVKDRVTAHSLLPHSLSPRLSTNAKHFAKQSQWSHLHETANSAVMQQDRCTGVWRDPHKIVCHDARQYQRCVWWRKMQYLNTFLNKHNPCFLILVCYCHSNGWLWDIISQI